jgi:hypothetical protein
VANDDETELDAHDALVACVALRALVAQLAVIVVGEYDAVVE